jgi:23S rRNA (uracil1939-C5)-methyltransferase
MDKPYHYRNKAQFPVGVNKEGKLIAGFYAGRTHDIIENTDCAIQHPCNHAIVETVLHFMREYGITAYDEKNHTGLVRHILTRVGVNTGEVMVCLVINGERLPKKEVFIQELLECPLEGAALQKLCIKSICLSYNTERTNVILGKRIENLYGQGYIEDTIGGIVYQISPLSFYQVNPLQTKKLYDTVLEYAALQGEEIVWDLYCGIGTISLFLAQKAAKVCGVEIIPQAVEDARRNAQRNHMNQVEFFVGAAEEVVPEQYAKSNGSLRADVVTLDPPRKGCEERLLQTVIEMQPQRIVYVSCDPATLARDLRYLCDRGYALKRVRACDMFGQSFHVETVCLLSRKDNRRKLEQKCSN